jgi:hypothetical protein
MRLPLLWLDWGRGESHVVKLLGRKRRKELVVLLISLPVSSEMMGYMSSVLRYGCLERRWGIRWY